MDRLCSRGTRAQLGGHRPEPPSAETNRSKIRASRGDRSHHAGHPSSGRRCHGMRLCLRARAEVRLLCRARRASHARACRSGREKRRAYHGARRPETGKRNPADGGGGPAALERQIKMNFILNHRYSDGNTPIRAEEASQLIPRISTMGELNEYEALNILQAREWAFDNRTMKSMDPLEEPYIRQLHRRMFENLWKWAGTYREHELNVGCDPREIPQRIPQLIGNVRYWLDHKTFPVDECLIRF